MTGVARKRWFHVLLGVFVFTALGLPAVAAEPQRSVVVLPTSTQGDVSQVAIDRIDDSLRRGLSSGGLTVVAGADVSACEDAECLVARAQSAGTNTAVQLRLVLEGRDYRVELLTVDRDGKLLSAAADCAICGFDEAATVVGDESSRLAAKLALGPKPASLTVDTTPAGALVYLDDELVGSSPLSFEVPVGEHELRMEKEAHGDKQASYLAVAGVKETLTFELIEKVEPVAPSRTMRVGGWVGVGAGAVFFGGGVGLLAIHHRPVPGRCDDPVNIDGSGLCRYRFTSVPIGATLLALGSAGLAAGTVWLLVDRKRRKDSRAQVRVIPSGLGLAGRF